MNSHRCRCGNATFMATKVDGRRLRLVCVACGEVLGDVVEERKPTRDDALHAMAKGMMKIEQRLADLEQFRQAGQPDNVARLEEVMP